MWFVLSSLFPAHAWTWVGTPVLTVMVDRPAHDLASGSAVLTKIRMHTCGGGYTDYSVGQTLDPTQPYSRSIGAGDWCGVTVVWGSDVEVSTTSATAVYDEPYTSAEIEDGDPFSVAMTPYEVASGTWSGVAPRLYVLIE